MSIIQAGHSEGLVVSDQRGIHCGNIWGRATWLSPKHRHFWTLLKETTETLRGEELSFLLY
jgi:hypothetical protein